ncbi:hypothetical protein [Paraburkholderia sp. J69-2]|uniref:hypothetical protein n=1 Tax=Paraburkholderia sp. J69-2 TaxID=2805437 RepID=UPI002AB1E088|nr:hypothetical protein [Paraburkholderia sp. J69-2]
MSIVILNRLDRQIQASVSTWGSGDPGWFVLVPGVEPNPNNTWGRDDDRGFVVSIRDGGSTKEYFVHANSTVTVDKNGVRDDRHLIHALTSR